MLKEIIKFIDKYDESNTEPLEKDWSGKKFVIIKTKSKEDTLVYDKLEMLDDDSKIAKWIDKNGYYEKVIKNFDSYVLPHALNKALGSTSGLSTYCFFAFKLSEKNLGNMEQKIDKTKFPNNDHKELIDNIHKILKDAISDLTKKQNNSFHYLNFQILIHVDEQKFNNWKQITSDFIKERTSKGKSELSVNGNCFVCNKNSNISNPNFLTNYDSKKIFLKHVTRHSKDGKGIPLRACGDCVLKLDKFDKILRYYKIKILPLFIEPEELYEEIKLLGDSLKTDENKFDFIFRQINKPSKKNIFDFYLVVKTKEYFFFDYISGYKWTIGNYVNFFGSDYDGVPITRLEFERKLAKVLTGRSSINYFDPIRGTDHQQATLIYSLRQKVFDFVYRNKNALTVRDLQSIILFMIEKCIKNKSEPSEETFNLFFNKHLLLQNSNSPTCILNDIQPAKDKITSDDIEKFVIDNDEEWAYFAGQMAYYLVSLSKSKDKTYGLLEPFTNKSTVKLVKNTIEQMVERYRHEINLNNKRFRKIASCILAHETDRSFMELKIPFYVGAFDDNVIYYKKK